MNKMTLVTGGAGFLGSHVVDILIKNGHNVVILDDLSGGFITNISPEAIFVRGSINNENLLDRIFDTYNFDYCFHLAAYAAENMSHFTRKFNYENNLIGSINLINRSIQHGIKHFIFTSSIAVYGSNQTPMSEKQTPKPKDPYGISKYAVELDLVAAHEMFGLNYTIFRPHNVYGERQNYVDPYRNVIAIFMQNIISGLPMTIYGDGNQTRAFTYISDVAPYIANAINVTAAKNQIFNIGADTPCSILYLAKKIATVMGVKPEIIFLPKRHEVLHAFSNHLKLKKIFVNKSLIDLDTGLQITAQWIKKARLKKTNKFKNIEIDKNIPQNWKKLIKNDK